MKLIIAEKPSLAKTVTKAIGKPEMKDGYFIAGEYIVTFAFGHLFRLNEIHEYKKVEDKRWYLDELPFYPKKFEFSLINDPGVKKQFNIIKKLAERDDVTEIINCGDSDREGQVIIRLILHYIGVKKPVYRLWLPEQTERTIRENLKIMKPDSEYTNLLNAGLTRTYMDWLYGINLTRYLTLKINNRDVWNVGRVVTAIVKAVYDRDLEIENFKSEKYYILESKTPIGDDTLTLVSKERFKDRAEAEKKATEKNKHKGKVLDIEQKEKAYPRKKLFSLSTLQGVLGKNFKMSPQQVLDTVQSLYEAGYVTYPRTNSEYLAKAEAGRIEDIISRLKNSSLFKVPMTKRVFDDSKVESHSAITPTIKIPKRGELNETQMNVYTTIMKRFQAVFGKDEFLIDETVATIDAAGEEIKIKGQIIKDSGWTIFEGVDLAEGTLPPIKKGDVFDLNFKVIEKETKPPKAYSVSTLNTYLKNPFAKDDKSDDELYEAMKKGVEIGTEATRAPTIEKAQKQGFITLSKNIYHITDKGRAYVRFLNELNIDISAEKTVEFQILIQSVYNKEMKTMDAVEKAKIKINEAFKSRETQLSGIPSGSDGIGKCPVCGNDVVKRKGTYGEFYSCRNRECKFKIAGEIAGKKITGTTAKNLLEKGSTGKLKGFTSKAGKSFDAKLIITDGEVKFSF